MPVCCATLKKTQNGSRRSYKHGSLRLGDKDSELHRRKAIASDRKQFGVDRRISAGFDPLWLPEQIAGNNCVGRSEFLPKCRLCRLASLREVSPDHLRVFLT